MRSDFSQSVLKSVTQADFFEYLLFISIENSDNKKIELTENKRVKMQ